MASYTGYSQPLEHDKTELMHFDRSNDLEDNPSLDLSRIPGVEGRKQFWRYLGFFFDRKLTFREHVRFYSTKALTTFKAMGALGNSVRGLSPKQKL